MTVRSLREGDRSEWLRMRRALWPACEDSMHSFEMDRQRAGAVTTEVLVAARESGALGGFIEVSVRDRVDGSFCEKVAHVEGWYVDPDLRGGGLGRRLMDEAESWAAARGLAELASDADLDDPGAIRAHAALGFRETFRLVHFIKPVRPDRRAR